MKKLTTWPAIFLFPVFLSAQDEATVKIPRLVKTAIGESGCAAYLPESMPNPAHGAARSMQFRPRAARTSPGSAGRWPG